MRPTLILAFVCALAASCLFLWMTGREASPRTSRPEISAPAQAAPQRREQPPEKAALEGVDPILEATRLVVEESQAFPEEPGPKKPLGHDSNETTVRGRVVDEKGRPVADAEVRAGAGRGPFFALDLAPSIRGAQRAEKSTDPQGYFELEVAHGGSVDFLVRADGYAPFKRADVPIPPGEKTELDDFELEPGAVLAGHVVDPAGRGVEGAEIIDVRDRSGVFGFGPLPAPIARTESDGSFLIAQLAVGEYRLRVHAEAHPYLIVEGLADNTGERVSGLVWVLEPGAEIVGRVIDIPRVDRGHLEVHATRTGDSLRMGEFGRSAEVDSDGRFRLRGLTPDVYYNVVARRPILSRFRFGSGAQSRSEPVQARAGDQGITVRYQPEGSIVFQLLDGSTRAPIEDFLVKAGSGLVPLELRDDNGALKTHHADGRVRFGGLRPATSEDRARLIVSAAGYAEYHLDDISLRVGQELDLGAIYLEPVPLLRVTVRTAEGVPVEGARVRLQRDMGGSMEIKRRIEITDDGHRGEVEMGEGRSTVTDEDGIGELSSYPGQRCKLIVRAHGYAPSTVDGLELPREGVSEQEVRLSRGGSVLVRVLDSNGIPMAAAKVGHRDTSSGPGVLGMWMVGESPGNRSVVSDTEGYARFENLREGVHSFRLQDDGSNNLPFGSGGEIVRVAGMGGQDEDSWREVQVVEDETAELTLMATPRGSLEGTLLESGAELTGATLNLKKFRDEVEHDPMALALAGFGGGGITERSDGKGEYEFTDVKEGRYKLEISHPTRSMSDEYEVEILEGRNSLDIDLPISIVEGRITDEEGDPIPGLTVKVERPRDEDPAVRGNFVMVVEAEDGGETSVISSGSPALGVSVKTDEDGRYSLRGVMPEVDLVVKAEGRGVQPGTSRRISLNPNETKRGIDIQLAAGGSILVEVLLADGAPARMIVVSAHYLGDEQDVQSKTDFIQRGSTTLTGLKPGRWIVRAQRVGPSGGGSRPEEEVTVQAGRTANASLSFD
ncbi:MAG: hypothetical protein CMJ89_17235 [Planctomycetes bacterium]|nr:hypothetical protein [Planctomycetota bacterium]